MDEDSGDRGSLAPGDLLEGRYRIIEVLGEGGVGVVFRAEHVKLRRPVAIKVLRERYVEHVSLRPRFEREAKALAAMSHPNVVAIGDYGVTEDGPYVVMELLTGRTLRDLLDEKVVLPAGRASALFRQLLRGLAYAHVRGLVHRDIKPGNVFLHSAAPEPERAVLLDFGFAKFVDPKGDDADKVISAIDEGFGTPAYIAPEQATGHPTDARTDVYSAGVVFFEMLSGRKPYEGEIHQLVRMHLEAPIPRFADVGSEMRESAELRLLLERALAKRPDDRFADAGELLSALDALPRPIVTHADPRAAARTHPGERKRMLPWVIAGVLALVAIWVWALSRPTDPSGPDPDGRDPSGSGPNEPEPEPMAASGVEEPLAPHLAPDSRVDPPPEPGRSPLPTPAAEREAAPGAEAESATAPVAVVAASPRSEHPLFTRIGDQLRHGDDPSQDDLRALREVARIDRTDPRPNLLLAWAYYRRGWWTDAVERYQLAHEADPDSRDDPRMLQHLLEIAKSAVVGRRAAWVIEHVYGEDALPAVERGLDNPDNGASARERLERLRQDILDST